ncbi:MAG TPA: MgtC/SapB family protein [Candidatus Limnocylindria bacterium]|jgi:putative Mg2+ transporter-C (MgtC) family protein|nr:MgtC/SapB family protein [Candidatus Limnocylindria bacterium]
MTITEFSLRLAVAFALGSLVGLERQYRQRMAGLRTTALVATGTALFIMITPLLGAVSNPTQIPAYVVSGIGFLAGGVIFKERLSVSGLNTAATIWCIAAVGALVGLGYLWQGVIGVGAILCGNVVLRPIAQRINRQPTDGTDVVSSYEVRAVCRQDVEERVRATMVSAISGHGMVLHALSSEDVEATVRVEVTAEVVVAGRADLRLEKVVTRLGVEPGVNAVSWKSVPADDEERAMLPEA